jgi:hypothetical protein
MMAVMKRKRLLLVLAALAVLAVVGTWVLWPRPERVTRENFARIRKGLSAAEVEAILGPCHAFEAPRPDGHSGWAWFSADDPPEWFSVEFDASGSVEETSAERAKGSRWEIGWRRAISRAKHVVGR